MTTQAEAIQPLEEPGFLAQHHFLLRKLHSLTGLIPVGAFMAFHLYENAHILIGPKAWNKGTGWIKELPLLYFIEICCIVVPILFHGIYGLWIVYTGQPNVDVYPLKKNYTYYLQRITGVLAFIFLAGHVGMTRVYSLVTGIDIKARFVETQIGEPVWLAFYIIGVLSCAFHFSNGLWNMGITWGFTIGKFAQKIWWYLCMLIGAALGVLGVAVALAFAL